jgi:hypothetical protein
MALTRRASSLSISRWRSAVTSRRIIRTHPASPRTAWQRIQSQPRLLPATR